MRKNLSWQHQKPAKKYRETGFEEALIEAKKIVVAMDIEPIFYVKKKRLIKKRTHFDEETRQDNNKSVVLNEEEKFRIDYFINIMDQKLVSFQTSLKESCINLEDSLKHGARSDIDGNDLFFEIKVFRETLPKGIKKTAEIIEFLKRLKDCYPNI
ncbi:hypothetical protein RND81_05G039000 [Saponaria officinalis]|uniref:Uncharacterized protein n=1 Tax=Saponaria officinalis TaxID=3572 RepID=A0AAW1KV98_SAPOF